MKHLKPIYPEFPDLGHPVVLFISMGREHEQYWAKTREEKYHLVCMYTEGQDQIVAVYDGEVYSIEDSDRFWDFYKEARAWDEEQS